MCNKSLVSIPCESDTLCGISSRFQLLSPTHRQVIHALLTRPPLSIAPEGTCSVRLECVMHAASVHPEPGSNSRMFCIKSRSVRVSNLYPSFCLFALYFLSCDSSSLLKDLSRFQNFRFVLRTISIVVQFSRIISADSPTGLSTAYLLYHPSPTLSIPFLNFFHLLFSSQAADPQKTLNFRPFSKKLCREIFISLHKNCEISCPRPRRLQSSTRDRILFEIFRNAPLDLFRCCFRKLIFPNHQLSNMLILRKGKIHLTYNRKQFFF